MIKRIILSASFTCLAAGMIWAGCVSSCRDSYDDDIRSCKRRYGDDPDDVDRLKRCFDSAKYDYESCVEECKN